ncbi:hypothetical protein H0H93_002878 [Arthromyces matolae]|nr:hypothetical protein H0H93_002878 [Arthromyces matolae]
MPSPTSPLQSGTTSNLTQRGRKFNRHVRASAAAIEALIEQYSVGLDPLPAKLAPRPILQGPVVVLLTGSTGNLGSEILVDLLKNDRVEHVYTFNRLSTRGDAIEERQIKAFNERRLDTNILRSEKLSYILGDATRQDLGIASDQYNRVRIFFYTQSFRMLTTVKLSTSVNVIIHNAWQVSFTSPLLDFEPHIQATRNLADFLRAGTHAAHGRFLFTSSVTSAQSWPPSKGPYPEEIVIDSSNAVGGGYGASKYIAERILAKSGLQTTSFRIGQICGGAPNGVWETTEWLPTLLKSSIAMKLFPDTRGVISWVPMNAVAAAIVEAASSSNALPEAVNLVNPRTTDMAAVNGYLIAATKELFGVNLNVVSPEQWVSAVERHSVNASAETLRDIPAIALLSHFREITRLMSRIPSSEVKVEYHLPTFTTEMMCRTSPRTMSSLRPIGKEDVELWIKYWQDINYLGKVKSRL